MKRTIKKLNNGDFEVQPDNTIVYGIRKYINEERTMREKLRPIHRTSIDKTPICISDPKEYYDTNKRVNQTVRDIGAKNDIAILDDIILSAHKRIAMYETLQQGTWYTIFRPDNTDEILRERELIREFKKMKSEIIEWQTKNTTQ